MKASAEDILIGGVPIDEIAGCTCLRVRRASRHLTRLYEQALAPTGLTIGQFGVLATLFGALTRGHAILSVGALAEFLGTDPTTLNRSLAPLESRGLVTSGRNPDDRRVRAIAITPAGHADLDQAARLWRDVNAAVEERLGAETNAFHRLLALSTTSPLAAETAAR